MANMDNNVIVHVGMPKTATSCFQSHVFPHHPQICYLGKYLDGTPKNQVGDSVPLAETLRLRSKFHHSDRECKAGLAGRAEDAFNSARRPLWSTEAICRGAISNRERCLELVRKVFGDIRIVMFLREPHDYVRSWYFQRLKGYNLKAPSTRKCAPKYGPPPVFYSPAEWLSETWDRADSVALDLEYADTVEMYLDCLGREAVCVLLYEELRDHTRATIGKLAGFMGVDAIKMHGLFTSNRANDRWTSAHLERLRKLQSFPLIRQLFRSIHPLRKWLLRPSSRRLKNAKRPSIELPADWQKRIDQVSRPQNRRMRKLTGLALGENGYRC